MIIIIILYHTPSSSSLSYPIIIIIIIPHHPHPHHITQQYIACERELGLDRNKTNLNGGAIAIGHPLGELLMYTYMI